MTDTDTEDRGGRFPERNSPARQTVEDAQGVERIVSREDGSWHPAPTEATENQKARAEEANLAQDEKREERLAALGVKQEESEAEGGTVADDHIDTVNPTSSANAAAFPDRPPGVGDYAEDWVGDGGNADTGSDDEPKGQELDDALDKKGLSKSGTADEKRARLRESQ